MRLLDVRYYLKVEGRYLTGHFVSADAHRFEERLNELLSYGLRKPVDGDVELWKAAIFDGKEECETKYIKEVSVADAMAERPCDLHLLEPGYAPKHCDIYDKRDAYKIKA